MAWLGHSGSQAPQLMHSSVMMVATLSPTPGELPDPDRLDVDELPDALLGDLPAVSRCLDSPEGQARIALYHAVDEDLARLEVLDQPLDLLRVLREGGGAEAVRSVVRQGDRVVEIPGPDHRCRWSEDLLTPGRRTLRVEQHRR